MGNVDKVIMRACSYSTSRSTYTTSSAAEVMYNRLNAESFFFLPWPYLGKFLFAWLRYSLQSSSLEWLYIAISIWHMR